jgi:hypothetical protein
MNSANNSHIADEILVKYLSGDATGAEQQQVQSWMNASEANRKHFSGLKQVWNESRNIAQVSAVDENAAWERFKQRTRQPRRVPVAWSGRWMKVAAVLMLLAGGSAVTYIMTHRETPAAVAKTELSPVNKTFSGQHNMQAPVTQPADNAKQADEPTLNETKEQKALAKYTPVKTKKFLKVNYESSLGNYKRTKDFICNATPCPLEICIIQNIKCSDGGYTSVSTCSILEPDESGQLRYKALDRITKNCVATIDEIRITQVTTGETIILNEDSKTTARDFFKYITGQKKGDILAGMFHTGCNDQDNDCGLSFDNNHGKLMLQ